MLARVVDGENEPLRVKYTVIKSKTLDHNLHVRPQNNIEHNFEIIFTVISSIDRSVCVAPRQQIIM